jgi:hypothetical protein
MMSSFCCVPLPGSQDMHVGFPCSGCLEPGAHKVHALLPFIDDTLPGWQGSQEVEFSREKVPGGQRSQLEEA